MKKTAGILLCGALSISMLTPVFAQTSFYQEPRSKKGLLCQTEQMIGDCFELGADQVIFNIPASMGLNDSYLRAYDSFLEKLAAEGITVTVVLLNDRQTVKPELLAAPQESACNYFMFNVFDEAGKAAVTEYVGGLASRFGDKVSNWVIGNEIQDQVWNYIGPMDVNAYCAKYAEVFKVCYDAVKAQNDRAEVYIPFDYGWKIPNTDVKYAGRDCIDILAKLLPKEMDWGVAWHAYPDPLTSPVFWDDGYASESVDSYIVNFRNLHILTDYMQREELKRPDGSVRNIILSEQGFTSKTPDGTVDESMQAAAYAYAYFIAESNPYIKAFHLNRQVDAKSEVNASHAFGLWNCDMNAAADETPAGKKYIWQVFRDIDTENNQYIKDLVKEKTGVSF